MQRLTHKRENGIKRGYWSPNKKQELVDRLAMYEHAAEKEEFGRWIPCSERLPEKPVAGEDCYLIQAQYVEQPFVTYWDGRNWTDECYEIAKHVIAWMPLPKPYREVDDEQNQ